MWLWFRKGQPRGYGIAEAAILYGIIPTFQPAQFGRVYAAYGGMFIVLSLLWGWAMDGLRPDRLDAMGAALCLVGMAVTMYAPRGRPSVAWKAEVPLRTTESRHVLACRGTADGA